MNKVLLIAGMLLATTVIGLAEDAKVDVDGASVGKWTMDFDAAKKLAAEKNLPILLNFSGSDWCYWCKIMEKNVFAKPAWGAYATDNLIVVLLDFPEDKSLVPEKYVERNIALRAKYSVRGLPSFILLDVDGATQLGQLSAGMDKTPANFQIELKMLLANGSTVLGKYASTLKPEDRIAFSALRDKIAKQKAALRAVKAGSKEDKNQETEIAESIEKLEKELTEFRISRLDKVRQKEYGTLLATLEKKQNELVEWLATQPKRTDENTKKFKAMNAELQGIKVKMMAY